MHELGVAFHVIEQVEEIAKENRVKQVTSVTLELGTVSGVIESQLVDVWDWAVKKHEIMKECKLKIEKIHAVTYCENCGKEYNTIIYGKICPHCNSDRTYLLRGNEFILKEIEAY